MNQDILRPHAAILTAATVVGAKEHAGPLGEHFDYFNDGDRFGQGTWEKAESEMQRMALSAALSKAGLDQSRVDIDDPVRPLFDKIRRQNGQKSGKHDHVDPMLSQHFRQRRLKRLLRHLLFGKTHGSHAVIGRSGQGIGILFIGDHQPNLPMGDVTGFFRIRSFLGNISCFGMYKLSNPTN